MTDELAPLSPRQRQIAEMIADGHTTKAICAKLSMGRRALRTHVERIVRKLKLDATKDTSVQITWLVIDARYEDVPGYDTPPPMPDEKKDAA